MSPPRCDFCSSPDVRWAFPCRDFVQEEKVLAVGQDNTTGELAFARVDITAGMHGGWAACPACHALVERGLRDKLVRRSARKMQKAGKLPRVPLEQVVALLRPLHDTFWANREGRPVPATREDTTR